MAYFKINNIDYSMYISSLKVDKMANYVAQTNAAGNSVVDYINAKRVIEVGIIPLDDTAMSELQTAINEFSVSVSFRNPQTNTLEENVVCIIPTSSVEYYTIQVNKVMYKAFSLKLIEL